VKKERLDVVGYWTEVKLSILREYASAYARIMQKQTRIRQFAYIDGFSGLGYHIAKSSRQRIEGSPIVALNIDPPFTHYYFIDMDEERADRLRFVTKGRADATVYEGDCNTVLLDKVFPQCRFEDYRRALCLLDPYQLNPNWEVVKVAGQMESIEVFLNFMIMDANMNVLWKNPDLVAAAQIDRMNLFWGDESWRTTSYPKEPGLFGEMEAKATNIDIALSYRERLKQIAGFRFVPEPMPMRNSRGAVIYYLFFASQNKTGEKIVRDIFDKYQKWGIAHGR
jgi:three-Cys-motif partner protein